MAPVSQLIYRAAVELDFTTLTIPVRLPGAPLLEDCAKGKLTSLQTACIVYEIWPGREGKNLRENILKHKC